MKILRGWVGEKKTAFKIWLSLNSKTYPRYHNVIIPSQNGTTQIDHLIISQFGLFIIETKNKKGWIYGSENQRNWTQIIYQNKYTFQNPLYQTYRQKKVLAEFLDINLSLVYTVVHFVGDCSFKTQLPKNVIRSRLGRFIKKHKEIKLSQQEFQKIVTKIDQHKSTSLLTKKDHLRSLNERHSSNTVCPKCGSKLIERMARQGTNVGSRFLGCSNYPRCRFTKDI